MSAGARVGTVVAGKYKLVERLGGGGMGEVFRAEHLYAGRVVALKLLRRDFAQDQDLTRRFFQEAQAVNKIRHPNIVDVLDAGFCEEGPYVAMEILEGSSLSAALARLTKLDVGTALSVVLPMLDALDAVHRQGIVHRDLKPENVFLARNSGSGTGGVTVKLVDFGIAKVLDSGTNTNTGVVFGTPDYLSPEQASGEGAVDGRSDLFAVGIVLFELLTGRRPFEAPSAVATAYRIVHASAPRLASLGVSVDARVQEAIDVALAKAPHDRFPNAASFADLLAQIAPEGATRKAKLVQLVDDVVGMQPTIALPHVDEAPSDATALPRDAVPLRLHDGAHEARDAREARDAEGVSTPAAPPSPAPPPAPPPTPARPVAPTLASNVIGAVRAYAMPEGPRAANTTPALRERPRPASEPARTLASSRPQTPPPPRVVSSSSSSLSPLSPGRATPPPARQSRPLPRRTTWTPRPLPAHCRGKCHTRGSVPRAASRWIERAFGGDARDEVLRAIPPDLADTYRRDGFNALVWYDLDALDTFLEAATAMLLGGDAGAWRDMARDNFDRDLGPIFRSSTSRAGDPVVLLKRSISAWARLYDFAGVRVGEPSSGASAATRVLVRFDGFDAASLAVRNATIGTAEGLLCSTVGGDVTSRVLAGESSFVRDFEFELAWPARGG